MSILETRLRLTQKIVKNITNRSLAMSIYVATVCLSFNSFHKKASKESDEDIFKCLDNVTGTTKGKKKIKRHELKHEL